MIHKPGGRLLPRRRPSLRKRKKVMLAAVSIAASINARRYLFKEKKFTADGHAFVEGLLGGSSAAFREALGVRPAVFSALLRELKEHGFGPTRNISAREHLAIFFWAARWAATSRLIAVTFGHSSTTVGKSFRRTLGFLLLPAFYGKYIKLPTSTTPVPTRIARDPSVRAFSAVVGAVDGTHVPARPPAEVRQRFRNRKGALSFNVLAACSFDMMFQYIYTGWEGSAADSMIFHRARQLSWRVPKGKMWLGDAGFPSCDSLLVPYRGTRYHLKEWGATAEQPRNAQELYNRKHASLRSVVERIFGVLQERFKILVTGCDYDLKTQASVFPALAVVHNFIRVHDPDDNGAHPDDTLQPAADLPASSVADEGDLCPATSTTNAEKKRAEKVREKVASSLWISYKVKKGALGM